MSPLALYEAHLQAKQIEFDPVQKKAILRLDLLYKALMNERKFLCRLFRQYRAAPKGIYFWGGVGRGKTFTMDLFYSALPFEEKVRMHFHRFMHFIHSELKRLQGQKDPLMQIAKVFSKRCQVLCFDEFHVSDISDAMILGELLKYLFRYRVVIVATSNTEPNNLYHNGLQRDKFLPAILNIYRHMDVFLFSQDKDYRLQFLSSAKCYHFPLNKLSQDELARAFERLAFDQQKQNRTLILCDREVSAEECAETVVWFRFENLCESARSSEDYIEVARCFPTVIVSGVKKMGTEHEAAAKRFMHMVDEFYERHVTLIISAEVPITELYAGTMITDAFQRTISRLTEMQSPEYLCKPHLP